MTSTESNLKFNKATIHIPLKHDANGDFDVTALRIGKQRVARKKKENLSQLKQAILLHRDATHPDIISDMAELPNPSHPSLAPMVSLEASPNSELDDLVYSTLKELSRLQARGNDQPPEKRYKYKRFVVGMREVERALGRKELKGVVVAVNIESADELTNAVSKIVTQCADDEIPLVHALTRRRLGRALDKSMKQCIVGIVSLEGVHQQWKNIVQLGRADLTE